MEREPFIPPSLDEIRTSPQYMTALQRSVDEILVAIPDFPEPRPGISTADALKSTIDQMVEELFLTDIVLSAKTKPYMYFNEYLDKLIRPLKFHPDAAKSKMANYLVRQAVLTILAFCESEVRDTEKANEVRTLLVSMMFHHLTD